MNCIEKNIQEIRSTIPKGVKLICVSKFHPKEAIEVAYNSGERCFGESRVQELQEKYPALPKDIEWHFIGHLQTNKVKYIAPYVALIHGIDSIKLLKAVNKEGQKIDRKIKCLLQMHIANEETKFGFSKQEIIDLLKSEEFQQMQNVEIVGMMGMATYTYDKEQIRKEFEQLASVHKQIKKEFFSEQTSFKELSMGMSSDYPIAIEKGSTMVRIGTTIFGKREY